MRRWIKSMAVVVLLLAMPQLSFAQYFQGLYDVDTSQDWGVDICLQPDGNYFIKGTFISTTAYRWALVNMQISADGSTILSKHIVTFDDTNAYHGVNLYLGYPGQLLQLPGGRYIAPISEYIDYHDSTGSVVQRAWGGLIKYNVTGDTVFIKTYTDTPLYYGEMLSCAIVTDGGYLAGGQQGLYTSSYPPGYLVRTDSMGDSIWAHTYQNDTTQMAQINHIIPLADGRIVVAATSTRIENPGPNEYYYNAPWFMLLDSLGNIIRDTVYNVGFQGGGFLYPDMNGGYVSMGSFDSLYYSDPNDIRNFPSYIAHMDSNFRITWITSFPFNAIDNHREKWLVYQLRDSSYIILGDQWLNTPPSNLGWAAKVNRSGGIVWNHYYQSDTSNSSIIRDVVELPNGNLVFTGESYNDTLPTWHSGEDIWLLGVDSNGCENEWCVPTRINNMQPTNSSILVYPNPATTILSFQYAYQSSVTIKIIDITGRLMDEQTLQNSTIASFNVASYTPGIYLYQVITNGKTQSGKVIVE